MPEARRPLCLHYTRARLSSCDRLPLAEPDQSPGQGARGSLVSAMFENTLSAAGPTAAADLVTQSKVISGSDV